MLTVNAHKGFSVFNRRFILRELREAVTAVAADVVFLQEVIGEHEHHARRFADWPPTPQYEYLADTIWEHCYGRNAVYPHGDHGNALLSRFPIRSYTNHDASVSRFEARGMLLPFEPVHTSNSAASGAWSDRCDQGRLGSTIGCWLWALRA